MQRKVNSPHALQVLIFPMPAVLSLSLEYCSMTLEEFLGYLRSFPRLESESMAILSSELLLHALSVSFAFTEIHLRICAGLLPGPVFNFLTRTKKTVTKIKID